MSERIEPVTSRCPWCGAMVVTNWLYDEVGNRGCLSSPDYVLVADWVLHSGCYDEMAEDAERRKL